MSVKAPLQPANPQAVGVKEQTVAVKSQGLDQPSEVDYRQEETPVLQNRLDHLRGIQAQSDADPLSITPRGRANIDREHQAISQELENRQNAQVRQNIVDKTLETTGRPGKTQRIKQPNAEIVPINQPKTEQVQPEITQLDVVETPAAKGPLTAEQLMEESRLEEAKNARPVERYDEEGNLIEIPTEEAGPIETRGEERYETTELDPAKMQADLEARYESGELPRPEPKKGRGRPALSEEEKARREAAKKPRGRPKKTSSEPEAKIVQGEEPTQEQVEAAGGEVVGEKPGTADVVETPEDVRAREDAVRAESIKADEMETAAETPAEPPKTSTEIPQMDRAGNAARVSNTQVTPAGNFWHNLHVGAPREPGERNGAHAFFQDPQVKAAFGLPENAPSKQVQQAVKDEFAARDGVDPQQYSLSKGVTPARMLALAREKGLDTAPMGEGESFSPWEKLNDATTGTFRRLKKGEVSRAGNEGVEDAGAQDAQNGNAQDLRGQLEASVDQERGQPGRASSAGSEPNESVQERTSQDLSEAGTQDAPQESRAKSPLQDVDPERAAVSQGDDREGRSRESR